MAQGLNSLTLRRLLFALGALIVAVNVLSAIWDLRNSRAVVERDALRNFSNLTSLLADQTARSLESIGILLHQAALDISRDGVGNPQLRARRLADRISGFPRIRALLVLDRNGHVVLSTDPGSVPGDDYSDRQYYRSHRDAILEGAFLSDPYIGRINYRWSFALSERLTDRDGAFAGVVAAVVDIEYVDRLFSTLDFGGSGFVTLLKRDGVLVTRVPKRDDLVGKRFDPASGILKRVAAGDRYSGWSPGAIDGKPSLVSVAPVPAWPLVIGVGSSEAVVLAPWVAESERVILRTLLTSIFMVALVLLAARELARRDRAEREAAAERECLQQRLRQSEKMEAIGRLAGGIAHDFNNILGGIIGYAEMLLEDMPQGTAQERHAHSLLVGARRARDLIEQILTYSRTHKVARRPVEMGRVVRETLEVMKGSMPPHVTLRGDLPTGPLVTVGNATQLHEVVMNLCTNAIQAMTSAGTLRVALEPIEIAKDLTLTHGVVAPGRYVKLTVSDTGAGMGEDTLARIFEPFFTTREVGGGTGLGLALVYRIVTDSGGAISVASKRGRGSTFEIYLPRVRDEEVVEPQADDKPQRGHGERILLVDDDVALLGMMSEMLERLGYEPEPFNDPRTAVAALQAQPEAYDLVLSDEAMPGLTGTALARAARDARRDLPVIIVTGRAEEVFTQAAREAGVREVLLKPLHMRDLAAALARQLPTGLVP